MRICNILVVIGLLMTVHQHAYCDFHFGPVNAVNKKVNEYNDKIKREAIDDGTWRGGHGEVYGTISSEFARLPDRGMYVYVNGVQSDFVYPRDNAATVTYAVRGLEEGLAYTVHISTSYYFSGVSPSDLKSTVIIRGRTMQNFILPARILDSSFSQLTSSYDDRDTYKLIAANSPYVVSRDIILRDLLIEPGVIIQFTGSFIFYAKGYIDAQGTSAKPVTFTSGRSVPAAGDYTTVTLGTSLTTMLNYVTFEYGTSLFLSGNSESSMANCTVKNNLSGSVSLQLAGTVTHCSFEDDIYIAGSPAISYCTISRTIGTNATTGQYSVNNCNLTKGSATILSHHANWTIDATNNWWGTTTPATIGSYINTTAGTVNYSPFLSSAEPTAGPQ